MSGIKKLIAPFQRVLLSKKLCPGCTMPLNKGERHKFEKNTVMVICNCRRMFVYSKNSDTYRRATLREAKIFAKKH